MKLLETFTLCKELLFEKQDGNGRTLPASFTFSDGVRVIHDINTGLYWEVKSPVEEDANYCLDQYSFQEALMEYPEKLNCIKYGGYEDWRMPNKDELRSILDYGLKEIAIDTKLFENCQIGDYWTKNVYKLQPYFGWAIFFGFGSGIAKSMDTKRYVMVVRGGHDRRFGESDLSRFKDNGDGTVTDEATGLMWQQSENARSGAELARKLCKEMTLGGYTDWRLPNIKELNTILNLKEAHSNWFFREFFPAKEVSGMLHYSSGTVFKNHYVWVTNFTYGYDGYYGGQNAPLLFRAVRDVKKKKATTDTFVITHTGEKEAYDLEGHSRTPSEVPGCDAGRITIPMRYELIEKDVLIKDLNTGLIWDIAHEAEEMTWEEAVAFIHTLNSQGFGGYADWRLPEREELRSIVRYDDRIPAIDTAYFTKARSELYWTAQEDKNNPSLAWGIYFGYGCAICFPKSTRACVRAVRAGMEGLFSRDAVERFVIHGDNTVTDKTTGLMWMQDETPLMTLYEAFEYCEGLNLAGYTDWQLPNMKELGSIVNLTEGKEWFYKKIFPATNIAPQGFYMASTTFDATFGWGCNFQFGFDGYYADRKNGKYPFRPVRKG